MQISFTPEFADRLNKEMVSRKRPHAKADCAKMENALKVTWR
jgi:hypothetical protein